MSVTVTDQTGVVIEHRVITNQKGPAIKLVNCVDAVVRFCCITDIQGVGVSLSNCVRCVVEQVAVRAATVGIEMDNCTECTIDHCRFEDCRDTMSSRPIGSAIRSTRCRQTKITYNCLFTDPATCGAGTGDIIYIGRNEGDESAVTEVSQNIIDGGGEHESGGGIVVDKDSVFVDVSHNVISNSGYYGIGVTGGSHIRITYNRLYSDKTATSHVGLYVRALKDATLDNILITENKVFWRDTHGESKPFTPPRVSGAYTERRNMWMHDWRNESDLPGDWAGFAAPFSRYVNQARNEAEEGSVIEEVDPDKPVYMVWRVVGDDATVVYYGNRRPE